MTQAAAKTDPIAFDPEWYVSEAERVGARVYAWVQDGELMGVYETMPDLGRPLTDAGRTLRIAGRSCHQDVAVRVAQHHR